MSVLNACHNVYTTPREMGFSSLVSLSILICSYGFLNIYTALPSSMSFDMVLFEHQGDEVEQQTKIKL